ncbi:class I SAM-dependent methyltransferase [Mycobacterium sp. 21AC1]|uniref:class I SAM-dependent methyltransferase n=1 Tax=[Mycobacterium] appelbergii TaxID=2939269 RepID=UPI0029391905|nr:class I SAM-dependent methyltransferase [Mycobacterium sp. 21AC1]MDV3125585.1 class I SAM-dependent methyltransferase [Mycobacterium sp. 21AC1]
MNTCRGCGGRHLQRVLDLGAVPAADHFPSAAEPVSAEETSHALAMDLCGDCGLAQLAADDTVTAEPRGIEPQALKDQAADAVTRVAAAGWLTGTTVREFGSPHGGSWLGLLAERGFAPLRTSTGAADVVLDCFGIMHEPDQRAAFSERAAATAADGVLLLQYHSLAAIVAQGQWNALRHGHFSYYSRRALERLLAHAGMSIAATWQFDLYGGTELIAAVHSSRRRWMRTGVVDAAHCVDDELVHGILQRAADQQVVALRSWLLDRQEAGVRVYGYGAASRAVSLFAMAGLDSTLIGAVADASPAKQGRRMPGTDIPIISPDALVDATPGLVVLTVPDMLPEVSSRLPKLAGRWVSIDRLPINS